MPKSDANLKSISLSVCLYSTEPAKTRWDSSLQVKRQLKIISRIISKLIKRNLANILLEIKETSSKYPLVCKFKPVLQKS